MFNEIIMTDRTAFAMAAAIYGGAFLFGFISLLMRRAYSRTIMFALLSVGFLIQTIALNLRGSEIKACPLGNQFEISQFLAWSLVLLFFIIGPAFRLRLLGVFTAGLTTILSVGSFVIPSWDRSYPPSIFGGSHWIELHAALAVFSYGFFAILSLVSAMFLIQQHGLKRKQFKGVYQYLPSVQQLDLMARRLLITGVIILTASLAFGAVFWINNHELVPIFKLTATCLIWLGYLTALILRIQKKLVTRRHAITTIALFILAMVSLWPVQSARNTEALTERLPTQVER